MSRSSGDMKMKIRWMWKSRKLRKLKRIIKIKINLKIKLGDAMEKK